MTISEWVHGDAPEGPKLVGRLDEALYAVNEADGWPDYVDSVSEEQAKFCWRIVERLRQETFPDELKP